MPSIARIRFTHVLYEGGNKRYNDVVFHFDGHNGAVVLENGGGKTVFIQTAIQAVFPHAELAGRKLKDTLQLDNGPAHIAIEWILADKPRRRYVVTCVSLFQTGTGIDSYRYVYEYGERDEHALEHIPFAKTHMGKSRPADKGEIHDYYQSMEHRDPLHAKMFGTIKEYRGYLEEQYQIISGEWEAIVKINDTEGGIEKFFDDCNSTKQLFDRLLIPRVEESIEGYEQGAFAKMFETHREGFEKYKQLKEQIEENKRILHELHTYVALFERLGREEQLYDEARREAKAYWQLTLGHHRTVEKERSLFQIQMDKHTEKNRILKRKQQSLELALEIQEQGAIETKLELVQTELESVERELQQAKNAYYSIKYAQNRDKHLLVQAQIKQWREQLERISLTEDERALEERWERNGGRLRYLFLEKEQALLNSFHHTEQRMLQLAKELENARSVTAKLNNDLKKHKYVQTQKETEIRMQREQQAKIASSLLNNPKLEKVEQQYLLWAEEEQQLEQHRLNYLEELGRLNKEREVLEQKRKETSEESGVLSEELTLLKGMYKQYQDDLEEIKHQLVSILPSWGQTSSLYEKEASIKQRLIEGIEKLRSKKQKLLMNERLAYRYVDDHGEQRLFFADAIVAKLCEQWANHYSLLQLGTDYIMGITDSLETKIDTQADGLWAVTLITTAKEKHSVQDRLRQVNGSFAFPIRVLSVQEASDFVQSTAETVISALSWVVPKHWNANEQPEVFTAWKNELANKAELIKLEREKVERDMGELESVQSRFSAFLNKYPLRVQQKQEQRRMNLQERIMELKRESERVDYELEENRRTETQRRKAAEEAGSKIQHLQYLIQQGQQYIQLGREVNRLEEELIPLRQQLELLNRQLKQKEKAEQLVVDDRDNLEKQKQELDFHIKYMRKEKLYQEVKDYTAIPWQGQLEEALAERKMMEMERHRILQEQTQLEDALKRDQEREQEYSQAMELLRKENMGILTDLPLPFDVEERMHTEWAKIEDQGRKQSVIKEESSRISEQLQTMTGACLKLRQQFTQQFSGQSPDSFREPLEVVKEKLKKEESILYDEMGQLSQQQQRNGKQLDELIQVLDVWNKNLLFFALEDMKLNTARVPEEEVTNFQYKPLFYTERSIEQLKVRKMAVDEEQQSVKRGRTKIKDFCLQHIKDTKLRHLTIQGIENKETYMDILEFEQSMQQRIQMAIHIWEQTLQTHDQELQQYILHIHSHLKLIVQELKEIPKKTRVKGDDGWKEIYSFTIVDWNEQDGKERIRKHIDWIIGKLERYRLEQDQVDWQEHQTRIRKDIEKWLDTRQLLQVVMQGEGLKVTCRKVMNDQQISKASFTWEQSNRWSGGEKWSKNMTLFLGLLNYIAERKQYIGTPMKRHRTVILDNPFGKASSDHVLSPVFFIAEQLGFQIIALTAHVEGKFLQDYFPIVYSCRLRQAADASKQIIEAFQNIQTAYFKDNDPDTLERIGRKVSQIEIPLVSL